jgi:hypothetical protein
MQTDPSDATRMDQSFNDHRDDTHLHVALHLIRHDEIESLCARHGTPRPGRRP